MQSYIETGAQPLAPSELLTQPTQVSDYPSSMVEPFLYPGRRPEHSFMTTVEGQVLPIAIRETMTSDGQRQAQFTVSSPEGVYDLNDLLGHYQVLPIEDRIPVVAFGSNASPGQLVKKFAPSMAEGAALDGMEQQIVPTLKGTMQNHVVAYSSKVGIRGYMFAELMEYPPSDGEATGSNAIDTEVFVNFLSPDQLEVMKRSEGAYHFCEIGSVNLESLSKPIVAYGFAGKNNVLLSEDGRPLLLNAVPTTADLPRATELEALASVAQTVGPSLEQTYANLPVALQISETLDLSPAERVRILGERLGTLMTYRTNFITRPRTEKTIYAYEPIDGQASEPLYGSAIIAELQAHGRVAANNLLQSIPIEKQDVKTPQTFGALYA